MIQSKPGPDKTILLIGYIGVGKTTLINAMCSSLFIESSEQTPIILTDEDTSRPKTGCSTTEMLTIYSISHLLPYKLNIIDTPGFGDAHAYERDKMLIEKWLNILRYTNYHGVDTVNAICLVARASDEIVSNFIFDLVVSSFENQVKNKTCILMILGKNNDKNNPKRQHFKFWTALPKRKEIIPCTMSTSIMIGPRSNNLSN